jgi:hypothetical protein
MDNQRPTKVKNLKIIDHIGTLYATFDGTTVWKMDKVAFGVLKMCDGKRTVDDIVGDISRMAAVSPEELKPVIEEMLRDFDSKRFIEWV